MVTLLEEVARKNSWHVASLLQTYEVESQAIVTTPSPYYQALRATDMARLLAGYIPSFIDDLALWVKEVETKLRTKGLNGNIFKTVLNSGSDYLKSCQELLEAAKGICRRMETITDSTGAEQLGKVIADN